MSSLFRSFGNVPILNQPEKPPSRDEMAADLAAEMCERIKALRAEARAREAAADEPMIETPELLECYATLEALTKGVHRMVVIPVMLEHFPEMSAPPSQQEKDAVERYLANQKPPEKPKGYEYGTCPNCGHDLEIAAMSCMGPHLYYPCPQCETNQNQVDLKS